MQANYLVWERAIIDGACSLDSMKGFEEDWQLTAGVPVGANFPASAQFHFDPEDKTGVALTDSLYNLDRLIVASDRLRGLLEKAAVPQVEYLPVPIYNHKKRLLSEPYCIVHLLAPVDCLVIDACEPRWSRMDKTEIARLKRLVIDESRVEPGRLLFRAKHYSAGILVHRSLAQQIDAAGLTGMRWIELADYPEV